MHEVKREGKSWTDDELEYLQSKWGVSSKKAIAKKLGRSYYSVYVKAYRIGLDDALYHLDGVTLNKLAEAIGVEYQIVSNWALKYRLPFKKKITAKSQSYKYITLKDWWLWAERNKQMIDFTRFDQYALPPEPEWVKSVRKANYEKKELLPKVHSTPWTSSEDARLKQLAKEGKVTYPEISLELQRSQGAIKRRIKDLKLENNIPRMDNRRIYTHEEIETLERMMLDGHSFVVIAMKLNRSESAVRGKAERMGYKFRNGVPYRVGRRWING